MSDRVEQETRVGELSVVTVARPDGDRTIRVEKRREGLCAVVAGPFRPTSPDAAPSLHAEVREKLERGALAPRPIEEATVRREAIEEVEEEELAALLASFLEVERDGATMAARELLSNLTVDAESFRLVRTPAAGDAGGGWEVLPSL